MHYDIDAYNRAYVDSEEDMLLFNIGRLSHHLPPHFMMLSEVDQTRTFSAGAAFAWTQLWDNLWVGPKTTTIGTRSSNAYQAGPFTAATLESPTFRFLPVQGQDFAERLESPLTDKFTYFLEERRWQPFDHPEYIKTVLQPLLQLFVESINVRYSNIKGCPKGIYQNLASQSGTAENYKTLWSCVHKWTVTDKDLVVENLEGGETLTTRTSTPPTARDVESALKEGYRWQKSGKEFVLTRWFQIPAYLNFDIRGTPEGNETCTENPSGAASDKLTWKFSTEPSYHDLARNVPKGYEWKYCKENAKPFELIPVQEPPEAVVLEKANLPYADEIIRAVEPFPQDYVYIELRNGGPKVDAKVAQNVCFPENNNWKSKGSEDAQKLLETTPKASVLCGYLKIGDFLSIMQRLADNACRPPADAPLDYKCPGYSFVGIGPKAQIPPWADHSAEFDGQEYVWVPAHPPTNDPKEENLAKRDLEMFLEVYKLYQTSLVDTSKLVSGTMPITISK